jgi:hypothetical protein
MRETFKTKDLIKHLPMAIFSHLLALQENTVEVTIVMPDKESYLLSEVIGKCLTDKESNKDITKAMQQILDITDFSISTYEKCLKEGLIKGEEE